jgi:hypothetical protein
MKRLLIAAASAAAGAASAAPIGYPGSTWGAVVFPASVGGEERSGQLVRDNVLLQGKLEQGVDWLRFGDDKYKLNTYAAIGYTFDNKGFSYNNKLSPALGVKVTRTVGTGTLDLGLQVVHEYRLKPGRTERKSDTGVQAYVGWWFGWDLKK